MRYALRGGNGRWFEGKWFALFNYVQKGVTRNELIYFCIL